MPSFGSLSGCAFYRPENGSWICVITGEVATKWVLNMCQLFLDGDHNVRCAIDADRVASAYFADWSLNCGMISAWCFWSRAWWRHWESHRGLVAWWACIFGPGNRYEVLRCSCAVTHDITRIYHVYY